MIKLLKITLFVSLLVLTSSVALAQPAGGGPPGGPGNNAPPPCWPPPCIPVDGGISFLIAIGAAFGGKKAYEHFKTKESLED
jgi:hypothetical protein